MKHQINTLLISSLIIFTGQAQAGLVRDGVWQIEEGDNLKSVLKTALPEQPLRQKRLKRLSPLLNKSSFDAKGQLIVGKNLRLPGVKMPSNEVIADSAQIGKILITNGPTTARAADGKQRVLNRGSAINKGDTIQTKGARAQLRFTDGSLVALRPNTEFKVEEYSFSGQQDGTERGIYNLLRGGFRTISGAIGKVNKNNYKVKTPVATIGIRGTHYGVTLCSAGSCADQGLADGLYGGVVDGSIKTTNNGGSSIFDNDEYFMITDLGSLAEALLAPPGVIFDDPAAPKLPNEEKAGDKKKSEKTKRAEEIVKAIIKEKKPDFDGTLDGEQVKEVQNTITKLEGAGVDFNNLPDTDTLLALLNSQSQPTAPTLPGTRASGAVASFSFVGINPNPSLPDGSIDSVVKTIRDNGTTSNVHTGSSQAHSQFLSGLSFEKDQGNNIKTIASIIGTSEANLSSTGVNTGLGLIWGRWSNTPIRVQGTGGLTAQSTPSTGITYAIASARKVLTSSSALTNAATNAGISSTVFMQDIGGVDPINLSGQTTSSMENSLDLDFINQSLNLDINAYFASDTYNLHTVSAVSFTDILSPGSKASLVGTCTGSTGGACEGATVNLTGDASFLFTSGTGDLGSPAIGAAVTYAGHGTSAGLDGSLGTADDALVGIAGTQIFSSVNPQ